MAGCRDGACILSVLQEPGGQRTNGGCGCLKDLYCDLPIQKAREFVAALKRGQEAENVLRLMEAMDSAKDLSKAQDAYENFKTKWWVKDEL